MINLSQIFDLLKFQMSVFFLKKEPPKETQIFRISKGCYFVMGGPIDMNVGVF